MSLVKKLGKLLSAGAFALSLSSCTAQDIKEPRLPGVELVKLPSGEKVFYGADEKGFTIKPNSSYPHFDFIYYRETFAIPTTPSEEVEKDICVWVYGDKKGGINYALHDKECDRTIDYVVFPDKSGKGAGAYFLIEGMHPGACMSLFKNPYAVKDCLESKFTPSPEIDTSGLKISEALVLHASYGVKKKIHTWKKMRGLLSKGSKLKPLSDSADSGYTETETGFLLFDESAYPRMFFMYAEEDLSDLVSREMKRDVCFMLFESGKDKIEFAYRDTDCDGKVDIYYYVEKGKSELEAMNLREETVAVCEKLGDPEAIEICLATEYVPVDKDAVLVSFADSRISASEAKLKIKEKILEWKTRK